MTKIWCMFSVANNYDQPNNNLVRWWSAKPSLEAVAMALGLTFPGKTDADTLAVVKCWQGEVVSPHGKDGDDCRLEEVPEGSAWKLNG